METYREDIIEALNALIYAREKIFERIVNLGMSGDFKEIQRVFQVGDSYTFTLEQFEDTTDVNLQKMIAVCRHIETTIFETLAFNEIDEDEVNEM